MNRIEGHLSEENKTYSETRTDLRKRLEKGMVDNTLDRIQLNDVMLIALVIIAAIVSFTDFYLSIENIVRLTTLTIFLYIVTSMIYRNRYAKGKQTGRLDFDYREALQAYRESRQAIYDNNAVGMVPEFCKSYKTKELQEYRESLLADVEMEYEEYQTKYRRLTLFAILRLKLPWDIKRTIIKCNRAKPLRLVPGMILNESGEANRNKLLGQSGKERERRDKKTQLISRAVVVLFGSMVVVDIIFDFSVVSIIQWMARMIPIIFAAFSGQDSGVCNVVITEANFKKDQTMVINLFHEFYAEKTKNKQVPENNDE